MEKKVIIQWFCILCESTRIIAQFILCWRQKCVLKQRRPIPSELQGRISRPNFELSRRYNIDLIHVEMFGCFLSACHHIWNNFLLGYTKLWNTCGAILNKMGVWPEEWDRERGESIVFICCVVLIINLVELPRNLLKTFVVEEKYGFNKISLRSFIIRWLEYVAMQSAWCTVAGIGILKIVDITGELHKFFWCVWLFLFLWNMITVAVYPNMIAPIFDAYTPLRMGRLRTRLHRLANFLQFPLDEILVQHRSWRSHHVKAYFIGLLNSKRIILSDTLLVGYPEADLPPRRSREVVWNNNEAGSIRTPSIIRRTSATGNFHERRSAVTGNDDMELSEYEIEAIVARLMGHWVQSHAVQEIFLIQSALFVFFLLFSYVYRNSDLFLALEVETHEKINKPVMLALRSLYFDVMDVFRITFVGGLLWCSRYREFQADLFATRLGYGEDLIDALIELNKGNLVYPYFDQWYWAFRFSTPSLHSRIVEIEEEMITMEKKHKKTK